MRIFLSHATPDERIADALRGLVTDLYGDAIEVAQSTDESPGGGIAPGSVWVEWIEQHIRSADTTYVLLTQNSITRPWVLWESGAAAGIALATRSERPIVPITFGVLDTEIPAALSRRHRVKGDSGGEKVGVVRLMQHLNTQLPEPLALDVFRSSVKRLVPPYLASVQDVLRDAPPAKRLLEQIPALVKPKSLAGYWVTSFDFASRDGRRRHHADIVDLQAVSTSRILVHNTEPAPRTEDHATPFFNQIDADIANRHLVGHWKNTSDERYFGSIHLAILQGENVMEGFYSSFASDIAVGSGLWRWVRIDPSTIAHADLTEARLREPKEIYDRVAAQSAYDSAIDLSEITELQ